jgi:hypothetical protein
MLNKIFIILTFCVYLCYSECPPINITHPCVCVKKDFGKILSCSGDLNFDISEVTKQISAYYSKDDEKAFFNFEFNNTAIKTFEEDAFHDLTFTNILFENCGIEKIHENAFHASRLTIEYFIVYVSKFMLNCNF